MGQPDDTPAPSESSLWVQQLNLKLSDRALLKNGDWLNDRLLDAVNNLVASHIGSEVNQSVLVCQSAAGFDAVQMETVMIIHDQNHWIATAVLRGQVYVMDSLRRRPLSATVKRQLKQIYALCIKNEKLEVDIVPTMQQPNAFDCGVYASAFAYEVAVNGIDGLKYVCNPYDVASMRPHLEKSLEHQLVSTFSQMGTSLARGGREKKTVRLII